VSGTPDQISDDEVPIPRLRVTFPPQPRLLLTRLWMVMRKSPSCISHTILLWFGVMVMLRFLSRALVFRAFPPTLRLFALYLPRRLAGAAYKGMDNSGVLFLPSTLFTQNQRSTSFRQMVQLNTVGHLKFQNGESHWQEILW
jgi:hypothetical protein